MYYLLRIHGEHTSTTCQHQLLQGPGGKVLWGPQFNTQLPPRLHALLEWGHMRERWGTVPAVDL